MQLTDLLKQTGGIGALARELGVSESQATSGASALLPSILAGLQKANGSGAGGGLGSLLGSLGGSGLLDQVLSAQPTNTAPGNELLGSIFGNKETSRAVAQQATASSGLDASTLQKMLPVLTMLVAGYLAKQGAAGGGLGAVLGKLGGGSTGGNPLTDLLGKLGR